METVLRFVPVPAALFLAAFVLAAGAAGLSADPVPQNVLDNSYNSCLQGCAAGHPQDKCTAYCSCSVDSIEEKFTAQEYQALNTVPGKSVVEQPIPQGSKDKLVAIINACGPKLQ
jgi:hypothetical protein